MRENAPGMNFLNYASRMLSLSDHEEGHGAILEKNIKRLQAKGDKMNTATIKKSNFAQLNDKRFYFFRRSSFITFLSSTVKQIK